MLAKLHGINPESVTRLADVQFSLNKTLPEMVSIAGLYLHDDPYSKEEVSKLLGLTEVELENKILSENTRDVSVFKLRQRALHVFQGRQLFFFLKDPHPFLKIKRFFLVPQKLIVFGNFEIFATADQLRHFKTWEN